MSEAGARPGRLPLDQALRAACAPAAGCPPPEAYLDLAEDRLPEAERRHLAGHAAGCPACAAEQELARAFAGPSGRGQDAGETTGRTGRPAERLAEQSDEGGIEPDLERDPVQDADADVAAIVARLEALDLPRRSIPQLAGVEQGSLSAAAPVVPLGEGAGRRTAVSQPPAAPALSGHRAAPQPPATPVQPGRLGGRQSRWRRPGQPGQRGTPPALRLVLAATLALALGWAVYLERAPEPPPLPGGPTSGAVRGGEVAGLVPQGELPELPAELSWEPVAGARAYRVTLREVDDTVLWQATVGAPRAVLPAGVRLRLHPAVAYDWSVEALDERGKTLAASVRASFRAQPTRAGTETE